MSCSLPLRILSVTIVALGLALLSGCASHAPTQSLSVTPTALTRTSAVVPAASSSAHSSPKPPRHDDNRVRFVNVASAAGLNYRWTIPGGRPLDALQGIGNGCAFLDYDNDGNLDILLVDPKLALYQGDGKGHFTDVTHATGLDRLHGHFLGCAVGDFDNDGYDDIYISGYQTGILLHNEALTYPPTPSLKGREDKHSALRLPLPSEPASVLGKGAGGLGRHFRDVTAAMGLQAQPWGTSCAFADLDGDGFLDLYVCNYVQFDSTTPHLCQIKGVRTVCGPHYYRELHGVLYHNLAGRRFEDVTKAWNTQSTGNDLGVAFADFDGSGRIGFAIVNDELGSDLMQNQRPGHFQNINQASGTAVNRYGRAVGGMGVDWGDVDNDGKLDYVVTTFQNEPKSFYHNEGNGVFKEESDVVGIEAPTLPYVGWGCKFFDADNDGWLDLMIANGHVQDNIAQIDKSATYREPLLFLHNAGGNPVVFTDSSESAGLKRLGNLVGRGLAVGDFDNDGRMDALVVDSEGKPLLLHNETRPVGHWLGVRLIGTKSNHDGYGAMLTVKIGKQTLVRQCHADGSYLSSSDSRVHFGLGRATKIETLIVRWPSGSEQILHNPATDRYVSITEH